MSGFFSFLFFIVETLQIGNYYENLTLIVNTDQMYNGNCDRPGACAECPAIRNRGIRYAESGDINGDVTLIGLFDVHNRGSDSYQCGTLNMAGFQQFLSFFYTFSEVCKYFAKCFVYIYIHFMISSFCDIHL